MFDDPTSPTGWTWLASYPRSGNTWMRFLLVTVLFGPVLRSRDVEARIPNIHRTSGSNGPSSWPYLCKSHLPFSARHPHLPRTRRFVYLLRSPKDVLLSNLDYLRMTTGEPTSATEFAKQFIENRGVPLWREAGLGSWPEHVGSWLWQASFPSLVLSYEELLSCPEETLARLVHFLGFPAGDAKIKEATLFCSFDRMKALERREKLGGERSLFQGSAAAARQGLHFVNRARAHQSLSGLGSGLDEVFDRAFRPFLEELVERLRSVMGERARHFERGL